MRCSAFEIFMGLSGIMSTKSARTPWSARYAHPD
jgi:hypothetical protein